MLEAGRTGQYKASREAHLICTLHNACIGPLRARWNWDRVISGREIGWRIYEAVEGGTMLQEHRDRGGFCRLYGIR